VATTSDHGRRAGLGKLLEARRGELGYESRPAFERATGLNTRLAADVEKGYRDNFKPDTIGRIAAAYQVTSGSMMAVLRGDAAELVPAAPPRPPPAPPVPAGGVPSWMTEEEKRRLQPWADEIWERLVRHGQDASGAVLFGAGTQDAADWDAWKARGVWSLREMVAMAAEVRRRLDARSHPAAGTA
jgi:hypothetical protein